MDLNNKDNIYNLSPEIKSTVDLISSLLDSYHNINNMLKLALEELKNKGELRDDQIKEMMNKLDINHKELVKVLSENLRDHRVILIGGEMGEIGGIKQDLNDILSLLKTKTPWYTIVAGLAAIVGSFGVLTTILYKLMQIASMLSGSGG